MASLVLAHPALLRSSLSVGLAPVRLAGQQARRTTHLRSFFAPALLEPLPQRTATARRHRRKLGSQLALRPLSSSASRLEPAPSSSAKEKAVATASSSSKEVTPSSGKKEQTRWQGIWAKVKHEALHYWHGTKLLGKEIRISIRLQGRLLAGKKLTRREHRQLKRTTQDLLRLIPFSVFLIVPFMELLLPVALKLFPGMLPSTFEDKFQADEKKRKLLKVRLEMAKFLQETIREGGLRSKDKIKDNAEFKEFFRKVRSTGESPTTDEVVKVAKLFEDDLTLDNLTRPQLVSMCRYMSINAFGTDNFLRYTIRARMKKIKEDDMVIDSEGLDALSSSELQAACQSRGIRTLGVSDEHLKKELSQWVDLHIHRGMSGTLMILSKAFAFNKPYSSDGSTEKDEIMMSLKDTLASLPDNLLSEAELEVSSDSASYKQRLEVLQQQEELIEDEEEQEAKEAEARRLKKEASEAAREEEKAKLAAEEAAKKEAEAKKEEQAKVEEEKDVADKLLPQDEVKEASAGEEKAAVPAEVAEEKQDPESIRLSGEQVTELGEALQILSAKSSVLKERTELKQLMAEHEVTEAAAAEGEEGAKPNPLAKRVKSILTKIDKQLEEYDNEVGNKLNMFETDADGQISVQDLKRALEVIRHRPSDEAIEVLLDKLDVDHDQRVPLSDIVSLAEGEGLGIVIGEDDVEVREIIQDVDSVYKPEEVGVAPTAPEEATPAPATPPKKLKKEDVVESN